MVKIGGIDYSLVTCKLTNADPAVFSLGAIFIRGSGYYVQHRFPECPIVFDLFQMVLITPDQLAGSVPIKPGTFIEIDQVKYIFVPINLLETTEESEATVKDSEPISKLKAQIIELAIKKDSDPIKKDSDPIKPKSEDINHINQINQIIIAGIMYTMIPCKKFIPPDVIKPGAMIDAEGKIHVYNIDLQSGKDVHTWTQMAELTSAQLCGMEPLTLGTYRAFGTDRYIFQKNAIQSKDVEKNSVEKFEEFTLESKILELEPVEENFLRVIIPKGSFLSITDYTGYRFKLEESLTFDIPEMKFFIRNNNKTWIPPNLERYKYSSLITIRIPANTKMLDEGRPVTFDKAPVCSCESFYFLLDLEMTTSYFHVNTVFPAREIIHGSLGGLNIGDKCDFSAKRINQ